MMISSVTITGINDEFDYQDLVDISRKYPYVEWGIHLCSNSGFGWPVCPSEEWIEGLLPYADKLRLQGILHDRWERDILAGNLSLKYEKPEWWRILKRLRVDIRNKSFSESVLESIHIIPEKEIILFTNNHLEIPNHANFNISPLLEVKEKSSFYCYCHDRSSCGYEISKNDVDFIINEKCWDSWISICDLGSDLLEIEYYLDKLEDCITLDNWMKALLKTDAGQKRISEYP